MDLLSHDIVARDGTRLRLWEYGLPKANEAVLFFHGAISPSRAILAPPTADRQYSWLHNVGSRIQRAYALDIRGYGESDTPWEYDQPAEDNDPVVRTQQAATDAADALRYVSDIFDTVHVVAVSWGTMYTGLLLSGTHPEIDDDIDDLVDSCTFVAPVYKPSWEWEPMAETMGLPTDLGAYYVRDKATAEAGSGGGELFEATWQTIVESNQGIDARHHKVPSGAQVDIRAATNGDPTFEPEDISVPSFVLRGTDDALSTRQDALTVYDGIETPGLKEYFELNESDHYIMHDEYREMVFDAVYDFQQHAQEFYE
jgi:pimeloyl-ACP methyl ester carboxylesterase